MKITSSLILMLSIVGCSHTTHMSPSEDGKTAWIAQDSIILMFTTSKKFFCIADDVKPKCIKAIDIDPEVPAPPEPIKQKPGKPMENDPVKQDNVFF